jgi:CRP-like cAMP-binding protein
MTRANRGLPAWLTAVTSRRSNRSTPPSVWPNPARRERYAVAAGGLDSRLRALRSTRELTHCSDSQLRSLLQYVDEIVVLTGWRGAVEGRLCNEFLIVIEGRLQAVSAGRGCQTLGPGDSWGWNAMWERLVNDATVVAESDARLLVMGHAQFRAVKAAVAPPEATVHQRDTADLGPEPTPMAGSISASGQEPRVTRGG